MLKTINNNANLKKGNSTIDVAFLIPLGIIGSKATDNACHISWAYLYFVLWGGGGGVGGGRGVVGGGGGGEGGGCNFVVRRGRMLSFSQQLFCHLSYKYKDNVVSCCDRHHFYVLKLAARTPPFPKYEHAIYSAQ